MTDLETLDAAIQTIATNGFATVTVAGQTTTLKSIDELLRWRDRLKADETAASDRPGLGLRIQSIRPYYP